MAVTETPPETVGATAAEPARVTAPPTGLAAVLGSGDHKVIGRLYIVTSLLFGVVVLVLGGAFAVEMIGADTLDVFGGETVFQLFTLYRVGTVFLLALPLVIGVAMVVVPLQVGSRAIAFPRAAAASYWAWLLGSVLLIASYAMNGGPGGGREAGVNLWIASLGLVTLAILTAAVCLATTVIALRTPGLRLSRAPMFAWSVLTAAVLWLLTLPVLIAMLALVYVDHRHGGGEAFGFNATIFSRVDWVLRNPLVYEVAIPALGFAADVLATTARARIGPRAIVQGAIGAFATLSFGAYRAAADADTYEALPVIVVGLLAVVPVLIVLALIGELFRRGSFRLTTGAAYAVSSLLILLLTTAAGALGTIPALEVTGTIYDLGVSQGAVLASVVASLGGIHWWATKVGRRPATEGTGLIAALLLLVGSATVVIADLVVGIVGEGGELAPDWTGGITAFSVISTIGVIILAGGLAAAGVSQLPILKADDDVPADPWEGQTLEWLAPSPPPVDNFVVPLPAVTSAEPLVDQREEK